MSNWLTGPPAELCEFGLCAKKLKGVRQFIFTKSAIPNCNMSIVTTAKTYDFGGTNQIYQLFTLQLDFIDVLGLILKDFRIFLGFLYLHST
jgi:hypothetical protein